MIERRTVIGSLVLGGLLLVAAAGPPNARAAGPSEAEELVTYGKAEHGRPLSTWPAEVRELAVRAAELVETHNDEYLGSYTDDSGRVVVVAGTPAGASIAEDSFSADPRVVVEHASISVNAANDIVDELIVMAPSLKDKTFIAGGYPQNRGVIIVLTSEPSASDRRALEQLAADYGIPVQVESLQGVVEHQLDDTRLTDPSAYAGGVATPSRTGLEAGQALEGASAAPPGSATCAMARSTCSRPGTAMRRTTAFGTTRGS